LVPGGGALLLPARVPLATALEIVLLGEDMSAERARQLGLVNRVVDDELVVETAAGLAAALAERPPATLRRVRHLMTVTAEQGAAASAAALTGLGTGEQLQAEAAAGIARFLGSSRA
jgi:enoyl-CoA hydratase